MQRVFVLDSNRKPLVPCHPARARQLMKNGRASVFRKYPFTIILNDRLQEESTMSPMRIKIDPGSRTTGIAIVQFGGKVLWVAEINHRGQQIKFGLERRRNRRRNRRSNLRYRPERFNNRSRSKKWLPPSLMSRVHNVFTWTFRLCRYAPIQAISMELIRFDTQKMQNPEILGVQYQQGKLQGYEVREYLLEKWGRKCAYCNSKNIPLEIEHIIPRGRGGSDRVDNLTIACRSCNLAKGTQTAKEFGFSKIQIKARKSLRDAAVMNATRWKLWQTLNEFSLPLEIGTGGRTKYNRFLQGLPKTHWIDAICVGKTGARVYVPTKMTPLSIKAKRHGKRQMCLMNKYGFPRTKAKKSSVVHGFKTNDLVVATIPFGKRSGTYIGRVAIRSRGYFRVGKIDSIPYQHCQILQMSDGYEYVESKQSLLSLK